MFMNLLITYLLVLKNEANYIIDDFVPESVQKRSLAYLQESFDIHKHFEYLFERRSNDSNVQAKYQNDKGDYKDEDWTIAQIVKKIRTSEIFTSLTKREQYSKEWSAKAMKDFFRTNIFYKNDVECNTSNKTTVLKGWRLKVGED